jgi:hypothetical protein
VSIHQLASLTINPLVDVGSAGRLLHENYEHASIVRAATSDKRLVCVGHDSCFISRKGDLTLSGGKFLAGRQLDMQQDSVVGSKA